LNCRCGASPPEFGGSFSKPTAYTELLGQAADLGFHTIGLSYPDTPTVGQRCGNDLGCYGPLRQSVFDGMPSPRSDVDAANSIQHRLAALLSDTPAGWIAGDHLTPLNHYAGFVHVDDPFSRKIRADWTALGLDGLGATDLNNGLPPSGGTHELLMTTPSARGLTAHALPVVDGTTPLCGNKTPQLGPVWRYLMLTAAGLPIPQLRSTC
jgi:hypothetical protein